MPSRLGDPMPTSKSDVLQGTLDLLVLRTLDVRGALHGYAITQHIQRGSADLLRVEEGSLYPALHRMEQAGWIRGDRKSTRLNSSHPSISYAVFCLKKKNDAS